MGAMQTIIKRGLLEEDYQGEKIERAMEKAFLSEGISVEQEKLHFLLGKVEESLAEKHSVSVEEIQNAVEEALMQNGDYKVARAYILYREKRTLLRHLRQRIKEDITSIDDLIALAESEAGKAIFGEEGAKNTAAAAKEAKAKGEDTCICPACQSGKILLANEREIIG